MKVHGACHCKRVTYEAEVDPDRVTICHCSDCQALTGSAYRVTVAARIEDFSLLSGTPKVYIKLGDNGARRAQAFCADCGSPLYTYAADAPKTYGLRTGCIAERHQLRSEEADLVLLGPGLDDGHRRDREDGSSVTLPLAAIRRACRPVFALNRVASMPTATGVPCAHRLREGELP